MNKFILFFVFLLTVSLFGGVVSATPVLNFTSPTPDNNSYISTNHTQINLTITESHLDTFKFSWNSTDYTFYDDSLVLALNFNNNSAIGENSTHAVDISKYGNNGTITPGTGGWTTDGKFNGAYVFDGSSTYVDCGNDPSLNITGAFTIEAWIKPIDIDACQFIVAKEQGINPWRGFAMYIDVNPDSIAFNVWSRGNYSHLGSST